MVRIALQFEAMMENLTKLVPQGEDFRWYLKLKCSHCGEDSGKWHYLTVEESTPVKGGRGSASLVQRCHLCQRESSIDIIRESIKPYCAEDSEQFRTMIVFECRGLEPTAFSPRIQIHSVSGIQNVNCSASWRYVLYRVSFRFAKCCSMIDFFHSLCYQSSSRCI
uniref:CXXC motif containing zinc binding protein n=1 Tax=Eptatretus burgeri TaxID=7764 RepID=A0A8C4NJF7_EPTBU